ncbi:hypothetical protein ES711_02705 [Gelidibacter salicanalis]|uniref:Uncharacterized protein n=1 Tax=Gelidibacter salicanalis TaxID=291193 RepID=A0A5C7AR32_9FLAO|nr:hypothetical protein [Gelidibacter salicanalis]TXE10831.1 hypothetical protein ES711_02705 [Gelidibacter salicanalis]
MKNLLLLIIGILIGALVSYVYLSKPDTDLTINAPKGLISPEQAKILDAAYNTRYKLISDSIVNRKGGDNRSSWYGLDQVRTYLNYAENQAKEQGHTMDGIRIYLGAHPDLNGEAGYTTMFFVPTGISHKSKAAMFNFSIADGSGDLPDGEGLDMGGNGNPPSANYPQ